MDNYAQRKREVASPSPTGGNRSTPVAGACIFDGHTMRGA